MLTNFSKILKLTTNMNKVIYTDARRTIEGKIVSQEKGTPGVHSTLTLKIRLKKLFKL